MIMMEGTINAESVGNLTFRTPPCTLTSRQSIIQMAKALEEEEVDPRKTQGRRLTR
jgi:hypothetical protein